MQYNVSRKELCRNARSQLSHEPLAQPSRSTDPGQRVTDEHVYHAGAAELGVHEHHPRGLFGYLTDDGGSFSAFEATRGFESRSHTGYEVFRSSLSAIQTLMTD